MMDVTELFCKVDDFCKGFEPTYKKQMLGSGKATRARNLSLSFSEMVTIVVMFHQSCFRHFKGFYTGKITTQMTDLFPNVLSYNRFVQLMPRIIVYLMAFLNSLQGQVTGISFMDSTPLAVCKNKRIPRNRVFQGSATRGKSSMGWFFGFKLHLIVNENGELLAWKLTKGNVDDRKPVPDLCTHIFGKLFADKGYISQSLSESLLKQGTRLFTTIRSNMKNKLLPLIDRLLLRKRFIIETINDQLKNISQIEHSRHRSPLNFIVNLFAGLIAYQLQPKKPSLNLNRSLLALI